MWKCEFVGQLYQKWAVVFIPRPFTSVILQWNEQLPSSHYIPKGLLCTLLEGRNYHFSREDIILCRGAEKNSNTNQATWETRREETSVKQAAPLAPLHNKAVPSAKATQRSSNGKVRHRADNLDFTPLRHKHLYTSSQGLHTNCAWRPFHSKSLWHGQDSNEMNCLEAIPPFNTYKCVLQHQLLLSIIKIHISYIFALGFKFFETSILFQLRFSVSFWFGFWRFWGFGGGLILVGCLGFFYC